MYVRAETQIDPATDRSQRTPVLLWVILGVFFLASLAVLPMLSLHRGDERFYTDAAIRMVQGGDWITPYYDDGVVRFRKPILPYWLVAGGFKLLGIGVASSRIGALLAATAMIGLTYRLALLLSRGDRRAAILAAIVIAANTLTMSMGVRATTDAAQAAAAMVTLCGLAGLCFDRRRLSHSAMFWIGLGLVGATKGGLVVLLLGFAIGFVLVCRRRLNIRLRDLFDLRALPIGVAVMSAWYVAVLMKHGSGAWREFWSDQVGSRLEGVGLGGIFSNLFDYGVAMPRDLLPWSLLPVVAAIGQWGRVREFFHREREACLFAAAWFVLLVIVFSFGNITRTRYLLPTYPAIAAVGAMLAVRLWTDAHAAARSLITTRALFVAVGVIGITFASLGWRIDRQVSLCGGAICAMVVLASIARRWLDRGDALWRHILALGLLLVLTQRTVDLLIRPSLTPANGPSLLAVLDSQGLRDANVATVEIPPGQRAQVRILSAGVARLMPMASGSKARMFSTFDAVVFMADRRVRMPEGFKIEPAGVINGEWRAADVVAVMLGKKSAKDVVAKQALRRMIAIREGPRSKTSNAFPASKPSGGNDVDDD